MSNQVDIKIINGNKICMKNSFCKHNLTDKCFKCCVYSGVLRFNKLFESVDSKSINKVINRIFN